jgi:H+/gluconate symporter-like permease
VHPIHLSRVSVTVAALIGLGIVADPAAEHLSGIEIVSQALAAGAIQAPRVHLPNTSYRFVLDGWQ